MHKLKKQAMFALAQMRVELQSVNEKKGLLETRIKGIEQRLSSDSPAFSPPEQITPRRKFSRNGETIKSKIIDLALLSLSSQKHIKTDDLILLAEAQGIALTAKDKVVCVSVILSKDDRFVSSWKKGWSLRNEESHFAGGFQS